jgi:Ca-activated chloride channel homolog
VSEIRSLHHFSFGSPHYLFALLLVPLFLAFAAVVRRRRSRYTVAFTNLDMLADIGPRRRGRWLRRAPLIALALALATCAAALSRPHVQLVASNRAATIVLLADVSGSMEATDVRPARIYAAVNAMHTFVEGLPKNDKVALMAFSDNIQALDAPTTNRDAIYSGLDVLSPEGGTALGAGVEAAVKLVVSSLGTAGVHHVPGQYLPAAIVLESDGTQDRGKVTPSAAAELARATGVRIYGVALGTRHGYITEGSGLLTRSIRVVPDPGTVALLARESGGQSFNATNADSLDTIYRHLGTSIGRRPELTEITSWFEVTAGVLLILGIGGARARGGALP